MANISYNNVLGNVSAWWDRRDSGRCLFEAFIPTQGSLPDWKKLNMYWSCPDCEPDTDALSEAQLKMQRTVQPVGDTVPILGHRYGGRGTPMNMAWYLGGKLKFSEATVWVEPVIKEWDSYPIKFDPENKWVKLSDRLIESQGNAFNGDAIASMPDLGDALTCFSLMRGTERLLLDIIEQPEIIVEKVREFTEAFIEAHKHFHSLYKKYWPGNASVLVWAPDTTYMCQCDFSTMISPEMFRQFVVPELNAISSYLKYMVWHLDGYEEVRHLPALLELPYIQAIQVQPGANRPSASTEPWMRICKQIQEAGKSLFVYANTPEEFQYLAKNLNRAGLIISCMYPLGGMGDFYHHLKVAEGG